MHLKDRTFKVRTWNSRGKVMAKPGLPLVNKVTMAEDIMSVEGIDLLVLTETHTDKAHPVITSRRHVVLAQSGKTTTSARVAILAPNDGSWSCLQALTIVPGHALLAQLNHRHSTETFWLLAIYADMSGRHASLLTFYTELRNFLADLAYSPEHSASWTGCLATGDWNAVKHPDDRAPRERPLASYRAVRHALTHVKSLCHLQDAAGPNAGPQGHTFSGTGLAPWTSRLDRIYYPLDSWWASKPTVISTLWSDHKLVWAECGITAPRVQIAKAAPRLPDTNELAKNQDFWGPVLEKYNTLASGAVTLEAWMAFKKDVLTLGLKARRTQRRNQSAEWRAALQGDAIPLEELPVTLDAVQRYVPEQPLNPRSCRWRSTVGGNPSNAQPRAKHPKISHCWQSALTPPPLMPPDDPAPAHPPPYPQNPEPTPAATPWLTGRALAPWARTAELLAQRIESCRKAAIRKHRDITLRHTRAWYQQLANKEADERGSRASISVDGLRLDDSTPPTTKLSQMVEITRSYFVDLHTPEPNPLEPLAVKAALLEEVAQAYSGLPPPEDPVSGPFTVEEVQAIWKRMPNTAPSPDGIQYSFWKALATRTEDQDLVPFWDTLLALTNDLHACGTDRCGFKDANISLFYKKGNPTLTKNYRPISSMNTDCKMWSNLINGRLAAWAVVKIHPDQKGFVPSRYITEHTHLAVEVAHLSDATRKNSYIVSLDQAKAYDCTDLPWLVTILTVMGVCKDLIALVKDHTHRCRARVRINSGYSSPFHLLQGVRQGDPLSCLLYAFSLEPLGHRLRTKIHGISVLNLPLAKLMMYADDTNLFFSATKDNLGEIADCLESTSYAIGCKFNLDKTDILPVGHPCHKEAARVNGVPLPGAYILAPSSP